MNACKTIVVSYRLTTDSLKLTMYGTWRDHWRGKTSRYCAAYCGAAVTIHKIRKKIAKTF